jgi:cysteine desulfurase/selenocysteine lyase
MSEPAKISGTAEWRDDFPALHQSVHGQPLVYLDSAASAQQPAAVIDAVARYQREDHANVHRGVHELSGRATEAFEGARDKVVDFINANSRSEVVLTSGTTASINLVAQSFARPRLRPGTKIVISYLEHHANIVPWQMVCEQTGAELAVAPINERGEIELEAMLDMIDDSTVLVGISHISNALGTICPVERIVEHAHAQNVPVLVDGAQAVPHLAVDVQALGCDFYAFSAHKMFGPTGTGVLWGRESLLDAMPPWQGGGDMILEVSFDQTTYNELPYKFEAGTPNISGAVGLGAAIDYLRQIGMAGIAAYEHALHDYMVAELAKIDGIRLFGQASNKASVQSFLIDDIHSHDIGTLLDHQGIAIRTGHHCAMPVMQLFGIPGTARASLALYNNRRDVDRLVAALRKAKDIFA